MYILNSKMGLTKQYLRYVHKASFGVVTSRKGDAIIVHSGHQGMTVASPALEDVVLWDLRKGEKVRTNACEGCHPLAMWYAYFAQIHTHALSQMHYHARGME